MKTPSHCALNKNKRLNRPRLLTLALAVAASFGCASSNAQQTTAENKERTAEPDKKAKVEEIRVNAAIEKDVGFNPRETQSAGKMPMSFLETPRAVGVVTRELMESRQVTDLQQALQTVAGVSPVTFGRRGFDDTNIRGFRSTESILIDGLAQSAGMWTRVQPYGYERVEVLKGASSILYGQVQPGGIINMVSKRPAQQAFGEISMLGGSFRHRQGALDINRPLNENGKFAIRVNALYSDKNDATDRVWYRHRWVAPSISFDLGANTDLVLYGTYNNAIWIRQQGISPVGTLLPNINGSVPVTRFSGEPSFGPYDVSKSTGGVTFEHRFSPALVLRHNSRGEREEGIGRGVFNGTLQANQRLQNRTVSFQEMDYYSVATDTSVLSEFSTGALSHRAVVGFDARRAMSNLGNRNCTIAPLDLFNPVYNVPVVCPAVRTTDAPSTLNVRALYAQNQMRFGNGWTGLVGARRDRSSIDTFNRINSRQTIQKSEASTFSGGIVKQWGKEWSTYVSYAESFLPVSGLTFAGNPFQPETGDQREVGIKYQSGNGGITSSLTFFDLKRQNVTTADPVNTGFSVQTGEQQSKGVEWELGVDLTRGLKASLSWATTDTKVTRDNNAAVVGKAINLTPRNVGTLWMTYRLPQFAQWTLGFGGRYVSEQKGTLTFSLPSYTVADASVAYLGAGYRINLSVKNLFDKAYFDGAINQNVVSPALPRNASVNLTIFF
jgi:iron complex outermembrane receptor protein